jgi:F0F1-type ATP synthase assembly protein I
VPIRLSASPFPIGGGLGIASLGVVVAMYRPGAWWFLIVAVAGGLGLGVLKVLRTRRRFRQDPQTFLLQHGTRPPAGPRG